MCVSPEFRLLHSLHHWHWNTLLYGLISSGENSAHFLQPIQLTSFPIFILPGTHHCWVDRGGMIWEACLTPVHMASCMIRAPVTHPRIGWALRCLTSMIWRELVSSWPCATMQEQGHRCYFPSPFLPTLIFTHLPVNSSLFNEAENCKHPGKPQTSQSRKINK